MRYVFAAIFVLHGLIHVIGVVQALRPEAVPQLTAFNADWPPAARVAGWGLAAVASIAAGIALAAGAGGVVWAALIGVALILSQVMIVSAWDDAKYGTIANVIATCGVVIALALAGFDQRADVVRGGIATGGRGPSQPAIAADDLARLPPPIARWLTASGVVGRVPVRVVELTQQGELRTTPDGAWHPVTAEQTFAVDPPAFAWHARVSMAGLPVRGLDEWHDGLGRMEIRVAGLIPVVDARGPRIDEGSLLRWLGEMVWFPSAALSPSVSWTPIDDSRARATLRVGDVEGSAEFTIDAQGRFVSMEAMRYLGGGADSKRERWVVPATAWKRFDGVQIPVEGEVVWKLPLGDFSYFRWKILDVRFDPAPRRAGDAAPAPSPRSSAMDGRAPAVPGSLARSG